MSIHDKQEIDFAKTALLDKLRRLKETNEDALVTEISHMNDIATAHVEAALDVLADSGKVTRDVREGRVRLWSGDRVHKVVLRVEPRQLVQVPRAARFLSVGIQNDHPVVWFLCDKEEPNETRILRCVTTGEDFNSDGLEFVGSVTIAGWHPIHVFEQFDGGPPDPIDTREKIEENRREAIERLPAPPKD